MTTSVAVVQVELKKYAKVSPGAFGLRGRKTIAIVRSSGMMLLLPSWTLVLNSIMCHLKYC